MDFENRQAFLTWEEMDGLSEELATAIRGLKGRKVYGIPRGGAALAGMLHGRHGLVAVMSPEDADCLVDDILDSGATKERFAASFPDKPFLVAVDKREPEWAGKWVVFPWEKSDAVEDHEDLGRRLIELCGDNPAREGMRDTPRRYLKAMREMTRGYGEDPAYHLSRVFGLADVEGVSTYDELINSGPIPFVSLCEHHLFPFYGHAHVCYIPKGNRVVGLSKIARMVQGFAARFQVQERFTRQVLDAMASALSPEGCGVVIKARHTCQCWRGVKADGRMVTSALHGVFRDNPMARAEMIQMMRMAED